MTLSDKLGAIKSKQVFLSILWVFILMNMIYADILNTIKPGYLVELEEMSNKLSEETVLIFAFLMEIPIIMIPLSRLLERKANRLAHFIAIPICILWVTLPTLMTVETPWSYIFFATVEVGTMLFLLYYAWNWKSGELIRT